MITARDLFLSWDLSEGLARISAERPNNEVAVVSASVGPEAVDSPLD
jgi:hypothetical protein